MLIQNLNFVSRFVLPIPMEITKQKVVLLVVQFLIISKLMHKIILTCVCMIVCLYLEHLKMIQLLDV
jgi:hypothetical protein